MSNKKITDLDAIASLADADLIEVVDDVAGTPTSKKSTWTTIKAFLISDTAYDESTWDGVTDIAPSQNAARDEFEKKLANVVEDTTPELGGEMDCGAHSIGFTQQAATGDGTTTIDWKLGNKFKFTFGAQDETFTFTAPSNQCNLLLTMLQDSTGGRDATWPATVKWLGAEPNWSLGGASKTILVSFYYDGVSFWGQATPWET